MITPPTLTATTFLKQFPTGRTKPCVFECVDHDGAPAGDYVVKLWANMEVPAVASMSEMVGALLAEELGLNVPAPAFIEIDPALADVVQELDVRQSVRGSAGINFGSAYKSGGYSAWQPGRRVPDGMHKQAFEVFAFDALIDNPDRRREKPNLLENGKRWSSLTTNWPSLSSMSSSRAQPRGSSRRQTTSTSTSSTRISSASSSSQAESERR